MTAILLLPHYAPREDWLKRRREGIGASEIAAVLGISPYDSPFSCWWRKHMGWSKEADDEMRVGSHLEGAIAAWCATEVLESSVVHQAGLYASCERPWQLATPDRLVCDPQMHDNPFPDDPSYEHHHPDKLTFALLECKWVAARWDGWGDDGSSVIPVHYRAQCLWQMDVMEVDEVFVCALGPGGFRTYRVRRDEKDLVMMREAGRRFMESLADGEPPDVDDHAATLPILRRLHTDIEDREQEIPAPVASGWLRSKRFKDLATRAEKRYAALLRAHLGTAKTAVLDGQRFAARTSDDKLTRSKR